MSLKIDLHTHSYGSPDGGLRMVDYKHMIESGKLDYIAITDHGSTEAALEIKKKLGSLGERIIVGEEIMTTDGEIIGLYLSRPIPDGKTPTETVAAIRKQGGVVYIPHPFETVRSGINAVGLATIIEEVDILESRNGRAVFQDKGGLTAQWAREHGLAQAASSDAHGWFGWGRTYSVVAEVPSRDNLPALLRQADYSVRRVGLGILYPKYHRVRKRMARS